MSEDFLTVTEAAEKLSVSTRTIQRYCKQGRLNYKWVTGKRHRELRIIPPIPITELPGVKKKGFPDEGFVSQEDFDTAIAKLRDDLTKRGERIERLEREIAALRGTGSGAQGSVDNGEMLSRAREIVYEYDRVRTVEKKLILKMAKEIRDHAAFLATLGMDASQTEDDTPE